jgi:SAM-dependent methyltransferase
VEWPDLAHSYDVVAADYAKQFAGELTGKPFDRELLDAFATEMSGTVLDVGCGPAGHVTRYLADRGVAAGGIDLSPGVVDLAAATHPDLRFQVADLRALPAADASLGGLVAFYSVIHLPRERFPEAFTEFHRVLRPGGTLLIAMHGGTGEVGVDNWFDREVSFRATLVELAELVGLIEAAGLTVTASHERPPYDFEHPTPRLYVLARR